MPTSSFRTRLRTWWLSPATRKERINGVLIGAFAGFWLGALGRLALAATPVSGTELAAYAGAGIVLFAGFGYRFPKVTLIVLFPFATFGTS